MMVLMGKRGGRGGTFLFIEQVKTEASLIKPMGDAYQKQKKIISKCYMLLNLDLPLVR